MPEQIRPPRAVVAKILARASASTGLDRRGLWRHMRSELAGTRYRFPTVLELWKSYRSLVKRGDIEKNERVERALRVKDVRTDSGVAPVTVLTKPYPCPGACVYCPTEARMPKSYVASEPAAARALSLKFDPYDQVVRRVHTLEKNGHEAKKIELIVKGGTWSSYRWDYRTWFIKRCFDAANHLGRAGAKTRYANLKASQDADETARYRIIGLTIETRPDWVNATEIARLRELGCTRVELGVQTLQDDVLRVTRRGHAVDATVRAVALLKQAGFKTDFHMLPGQPGSTPKKDLEDFRTLFADPRFRPDMIKLYPCVVLPSAELHGWTEEGRFTPLEGEGLKELLIKMLTLVPRFCRVSRLVRDFPEREISFGSTVTNLRETIETEMKQRGLACQCLRCREVGHVKGMDPSAVTPTLFEEWYDNAGGREAFLSMEDAGRKAVFAFLRLRLPPNPADLRRMAPYAGDPAFVRESRAVEAAFPVLENAAIVRELHTYGTALDLKQNDKNAAQHKGYGRLLMQKAEDIARREGYKNITVISGIGVREYYRGLGYRERDTYMVKVLP